MPHDLHETALESGQWSDFAKEATAFSPDSLARAILSADSVKYIAKAIRGEFDYRANTEVLFDKLRHLIESGLDDLDKNWNEAKKAELNKYVSTQKRSDRKKRSARGDKPDDAVGPSAADAITATISATPAPSLAATVDDKKAAS